MKSWYDPSAHTISTSLGECERVVKSVYSVLLRLTPQYSVFRLVKLKGGRYIESGEADKYVTWKNFGRKNLPSEISLKIAGYYSLEFFKKAQMVFSAISLLEKDF